MQYNINMKGAGTMLTIKKISEIVSGIAHEYNIKKITLFGSYADGKNTPQSDIDLLVEFNSESVSLLTLASLKYRLEELFGTDVDVIHAPLDEDAMIIPQRMIEIYAA